MDVVERAKLRRAQNQSGNTDKKPDENDAASDLDYKPFPLEVLPQVVQDFVKQGARAFSIDPAFLAVPALVVLSSMIGVTRCLQIKRTWRVYPIVWAGVVAISSAMKSPPWKAVMRPVWSLTKKLRQQHKEKVARFKEEQKDGREGEDPGHCKSLFVGDCTIERMGEILEENPRGILCALDELRQWFGNLCRYKSKGESSDDSKWLELFDGGVLKIDRKHGAKNDIFVENAAAWITGTIQPGILAQSINPGHYQSGLVSRWLFAMPPDQLREWSEAEIPEDVQQGFDNLVSCLSGLGFAKDGKDADPVPIRFTDETKKKWVPWFNKMERERFYSTDEDRKARIGKLISYAARFTLLHHVVIAINEPGGRLEGVQLDSLEAGLKLANWFDREGERVERVLSESDDERQLRQTIEWLRRHNGQASVREFQNGNSRRFKKTKDAREALNAVVLGKLGEWVEHRNANGVRLEYLKLHSGRHSDTSDTSSRVDEEGADDTSSSEDGTSRLTPQIPGEKLDVSEVSECRRDSGLLDTDAGVSSKCRRGQGEVSSHVDETEDEREARLEREAIQAEGRLILP